jgi:hypothetical protein
VYQYGVADLGVNERDADLFGGHAGVHESQIVTEQPHDRSTFS